MSQWAEIRQMHVGGRRAEEADCRAVGLGYQDGAPGGGAGDGAGATSGVATPVIWNRWRAQIEQWLWQDRRLTAKRIRRLLLPVLERKHRAVPEATALQDWALAPVWQQVRTALRQQTRKPDQEWVRMLRLLETYPRPRPSSPATHPGSRPCACCCASGRLAPGPRSARSPPSGRIWPGSRSPPRRWPPMTS